MDLASALGVLSVVGGLSYAAARADADNDLRAAYQEQLSKISDTSYRRPVPPSVGQYQQRQQLDGIRGPLYTVKGFTMGAGGSVKVVLHDPVTGQDYHRPAEGRIASAI